MKLSQITKGPKGNISDVGPNQINLWSPDLRMPRFCWHGNEAKNENAFNERVLGK